MPIEQEPIDVVVERVGSGRVERVLVRRGAPLRARDVVLARRSGAERPELCRVAHVNGRRVALQPATDAPDAAITWLAEREAVLGTLLVRWQFDDSPR